MTDREKEEDVTLKKCDSKLERERILEDARACICGDREKDYGSPENNFGTISKLWSDYLGHPISSTDVAMMMALLKISRIKNGGGTGDSFVDLAGYAACGGELALKEKKNERI